jgi:hypothetical protein
MFENRVRVDCWCQPPRFALLLPLPTAQTDLMQLLLVKKLCGGEQGAQLSTVPHHRAQNKSCPVLLTNSLCHAALPQRPARELIGKSSEKALKGGPDGERGAGNASL